ncbi:MAG: histidine kinase [Flavobacteriales bacterium]|jgi:signal transduction histidine kinase|nr:histidine kinase [Flavobacteriales bacterium]
MNELKNQIFYILMIFILSINQQVCAQNSVISINEYETYNDALKLERVYFLIDAFTYSDDSLAMHYANEYLDLATKYDHSLHLGAAYRRIGIIYFNRNNLVKALEFHKKALDIDLKRKNNQMAINSDVTNIAKIYILTKDYDKAIRLCEQILASNKHKGTPKMMAVSQGILANIYIAKKANQKAYNLLNKALRNIQLKSKLDTWNNKKYYEPYLADILVYYISVCLEGQFEQCDVDNDLLKLKGLIEKYELNNLRADFSYFENKNCFNKNKTLCKEQELNNYQNILNEEGSYDKVVRILELKRNYYHHQNDIEKVLNTMDQIVSLKEKQFEYDKNSFLTRYQTEFETNMAVSEKERAMILVEKSEDRIRFFIILLIALILIIAFGSKAYSNKRNLMEHELSLQKRTIDELISKNELESLKGIVQGSNAERQKISHHLHDTIGAMLATVKFQFESLRMGNQKSQETKEQLFQSTEELIDTSCTAVRRLAHDLNKSSEQFNLYENIISLKNSLELAQKAKVTVEASEYENSKIASYGYELNNVIQELFSNTLKHAKATEIHVQLAMFDNIFQILFEDNGVGFEIEKITQGLGLKSIRKRVNKLKGSLEIDSHRNSGTTFIIEIPLKNE